MATYAKRKQYANEWKCLRKMGDPVTQIVSLRRVNGKSEVLVQWACSWNTVDKLAGQAVAQVLATRIKEGLLEVLVQWCCTWTEVDDELMSGDLWQPFLDGEAIAEADEAEKSEDETKTKPGAKRGLLATAGESRDVRRSSRFKK
jgi:hypothetical protein